MWSIAIEGLADGMEKVPVKEMATMLERMKDVGKELKGGVFGALEPMRKHRFGPLRAWPKWKTLKKVWRSEEDKSAEKEKEKEKEEEDAQQGEREGRILQDVWPDEWEEIKWRPLVSYAAHHWKRALSKAGKFCSYLTKRMGYGQHRDDPRMVTEEIHGFNRGLRQGKSVEYKDAERRREDDQGEGLVGQRQRGRRRKRITKAERKKRRGERAFEDRELEVILRDIGCFFTNVPWEVFREALKSAIRDLQREGARRGQEWNWF